MMVRFSSGAVAGSPAVVVDIGDGWVLADAKPGLVAIGDPTTGADVFRPNVLAFVRAAEGADPVAEIRPTLETQPGATFTDRDGGFAVDLEFVGSPTGAAPGEDLAAAPGEDPTEDERPRLLQHHDLSLVTAPDGRRVVLHVVATARPGQLDEAVRRADILVASAYAEPETP